METTTTIDCLKCGKPIRPLGLHSVACHCASFTFNLDNINSEGFSGWPVTLADLGEIIGNRTEAPETSLVFNHREGGRIDYISGRQPIERGDRVAVGDTVSIPSRGRLVVKEMERCASRMGSYIRVRATDENGRYYSVNELYVTKTEGSN